MNSTRIQEVFKTFGKLINLDRNYGTPYASGLRSAFTAVQRQIATATNAADPYDELLTVVYPLLNAARSIVQGLDRLPLTAKAGVDAYVQIIGSELSQANGTPPATVLSALASTMTSAGQTVAPSGTFYKYFFTTYGVQLPQSGSATISDGLITTVIV